MSSGLEDIFGKRGWELKRSDFKPEENGNNYKQIFDEVKKLSLNVSTELYVIVFLLLRLEVIIES